MKNVVELIKDNFKTVAIVTLALILGGTFLFKDNGLHKNSSVAVNRTSHNKVVKPKSTSNVKKEYFNVDIQGAVQYPGVYRLKKGAIIQQAVNLAGGMLENADVRQINQAQSVSDQMQIYVPRFGEEGTGNAGSLSTDNGNSKIVNIKSATLEELQTISGIVPMKAQKIISYR